MFSCSCVFIGLRSGTGGDIKRSNCRWGIEPGPFCGRAFLSSLLSSVSEKRKLGFCSLVSFVDFWPSSYVIVEKLCAEKEKNEKRKVEKKVIVVNRIRTCEG